MANVETDCFGTSIYPDERGDAIADRVALLIGGMTYGEWRAVRDAVDEAFDMRARLIDAADLNEMDLHSAIRLSLDKAGY